MKQTVCITNDIWFFKSFGVPAYSQKLCATKILNILSYIYCNYCYIYKSKPFSLLYPPLPRHFQCASSSNFLLSDKHPPQVEANLCTSYSQLQKQTEIRTATDTVTGKGGWQPYIRFLLGVGSPFAISEQKYVQLDQNKSLFSNKLWQCR